MDGARLFNALVAKGESPSQYGAICDTISLCLSKGLGAPVGSLLLGSTKHIGAAHRVRKVMGGAMRQAGYLAAAGLYALDHHVDRLRDDHRKARALEAELQKMSYVSEVLPVETNIVIFKLDPAMSTERFLGHLNERGVKALSLGPRMIRIVFHLDVSDAQFDALVGALRSLH